MLGAESESSELFSGEKMLFFLLASSFAAAAAAATLVLLVFVVLFVVAGLTTGFCTGLEFCDFMEGGGFCWMDFGVTVAVLLGLALKFFLFADLLFFGSSSSSEE